MPGEERKHPHRKTRQLLEEVLRRLTQQQAFLEKNMAKIDDSIAALKAQVEQNTAVEKSALILIQGFAARLDTAIAAATAAGATPAQIAELNDLSTAVKSSDDELSAAVQANTPPAPPAA